MIDTELHIAIGTYPHVSQGSVWLEGELRLLKPALLYADTVSLYSPAANMVGIFRGMAQLDVAQKLLLIQQLAPVLFPDEGLAFLSSLKALRNSKLKHGKPKAELLRLMQFERELHAEIERNWHQYVLPGVETMLEQSGANQLLTAVDSGLLCVEPVLSGGKGYDSEEAVKAFVAKIGDVISGNAYPLFDDETGTLVRLGVAEGLFHPTTVGIDRGKQVTMASRFMGHLPAFPTASVNEILDIREEMRAPLIRFRAAMSTLGRLANLAAYEEGFDGQVDDLYREQIAPALVEIAELIQTNTYLRSFRGEIGENIVTIAAAVMTIGLTHASGNSHAAVDAITSSAPVVQAMLNAALKMHEQADHIIRTSDNHRRVRGRRSWGHQW